MISELIDASDARAQDILNEILERYQKKLEDAVNNMGDIPADKKKIMQDQKALLEAIDARRSLGALREVLRNNPLPFLIPSHRVLRGDNVKELPLGYDIQSILLEMEEGTGKRYRPGKYLHPSI